MRPDAGTVPRFTGYRERMKPDLLRILLLATLLSSAACRSARLQSVEDGRDTWRTDRLDIDRDGGLITVDVTGIAGERASVFLLDASAARRLTDYLDVEPLAVGTGRLAADGLEVRFTDLPPGTYLVGAFLDRDGDGVLVLRETLTGAIFDEPHAAMSSIQVAPSGAHRVELRVEDPTS